jgi:hypothetical protein
VSPRFIEVEALRIRYAASVGDLRKLYDNAGFWFYNAPSDYVMMWAALRHEARNEIERRTRNR